MTRTLRALHLGCLAIALTAMNACALHEGNGKRSVLMTSPQADPASMQEDAPLPDTDMAGQQPFGVSSAPDQIAAPGMAASTDMAVQPAALPSYAALTQANTNGNVQVFSLDDPMPSANGGNPIDIRPIGAGSPDMDGMPGGAPETGAGSVLAMHGVPYARDSNVEVFPLDGSVTPMGQSPMGSGTYAPIMTAGGTAVPLTSENSHKWVADSTDSNKIFFQNGSSVIGASSKDVISQIAANAGDGQIRVEGHASKRTATKDPVEARIINLRISMKRALSVSQALIKKGVPAPNIKTTAWGDTQPPAETQGMTAEAAARRVEIFTQSK